MPPIASPAAVAAAPGQGEPAALARSVVLVGLMGAGKTSIGRRLARALDAPFADADQEIVTAAGISIPDIFALYGEPRFRDLERRVVARLLDQPPMVLALGGGAYVDPATRALVKERGVSLWLRANLDTLLARTMRKKGARPLLSQGEPREVLARLMSERYPIYAEADHTIETHVEPHEAVVERILGIVRPRAREA
jgi:shikimate kinase